MLPDVAGGPMKTTGQSPGDWYGDDCDWSRPVAAPVHARISSEKPAGPPKTPHTSRPETARQESGGGPAVGRAGVRQRIRPPGGESRGVADSGDRDTSPIRRGLVPR